MTTYTTTQKVYRYTKSHLLNHFKVHEEEVPSFVSQLEGVTCGGSSQHAGPMMPTHRPSGESPGEVFQRFSKDERINPHFVERRAQSRSHRSHYPRSRHRFAHSSASHEHSEDEKQPEWANVSIHELKQANASKDAAISLNDKYIYIDKTGHIEGPVTLAQLSEWVDLMILNENTDVKREDHFEFQKLSAVLQHFNNQQASTDDQSQPSTPLPEFFSQPQHKLPLHVNTNQNMLNESPSRVLDHDASARSSRLANPPHLLTSFPPSSSNLPSGEPYTAPPLLTSTAPADSSSQNHTPTSSTPFAAPSRSNDHHFNPSPSQPSYSAMPQTPHSAGGVPYSHPQSHHQSPFPPPYPPAHYSQQYPASHFPQQPPPHSAYPNQQQHLHMGYPQHHQQMHHIQQQQMHPSSFAIFGQQQQQQQHSHFHPQQQQQHRPQQQQHQQQQQPAASSGNAAVPQSAGSNLSALGSAQESSPFNVSPFSLEQQQSFNAEDLESQLLSTPKQAPTPSEKVPAKENQTAKQSTQKKAASTSVKNDEEEEEFKTVGSKKKSSKPATGGTETLSFGSTPSKTSPAKQNKSKGRQAPLIAKPPRPQPVVQHAHEIPPDTSATATAKKEESPQRVIARSNDDDDLSMYAPPQRARTQIAPPSNPWGEGGAGPATPSPVPASSGSVDMKKILAEQTKESRKHKRLEKKQKAAEMAQKSLGAWPSAAPAPVQSSSAVSFSEIAKQEEAARRKQKKQEQKKAITRGSAADIVRASSGSSNAWGAPSAKNSQPSLSQILKEEKKKSKKSKTKTTTPSGGWSDALSTPNQGGAAWGGAAPAPAVVAAPAVKKSAPAQEKQQAAGFWSFSDNSKPAAAPVSEPKQKKKKSKKAKAKSTSSWAGSVGTSNSQQKPSVSNDDFPVLNAFGGATRIPKSFREWFKSECKQMGKPDLANESLLSFLWSVPDDELNSYVDNYFGRANRSFASEFLSQRSFEKGQVDRVPKRGRR